jgi:hypothetical protein
MSKRDLKNAGLSVVPTIGHGAATNAAAQAVRMLDELGAEVVEHCPAPNCGVCRPRLGAAA